MARLDFSENSKGFGGGVDFIPGNGQQPPFSLACPLINPIHTFEKSPLILYEYLHMPHPARENSS